MGEGLTQVVVIGMGVLLVTGTGDFGKVLHVYLIYVLNFCKIRWSLNPARYLW